MMWALKCILIKKKKESREESTWSSWEIIGDEIFYFLFFQLETRLSVCSFPSQQIAWEEVFER